MKTLKLVSFVIFVGAIAGCAGPMKMYAGNDLPREQLSHVHFTNAPGFFSQFYISVISLDERDFFKEPYSYAQAYVTPGKHKMRVTFTDFENYIIPINFKQKQFQGYYEIEFETKAGMQYAPIFNMNYKEREMLSEMCVAEVTQGDSISKSKDVKSYVGCGKPTIEPTADNIKLCKQWSWIAYTPKTYAEACKVITN